ncbi:MAG: TrmH family RNA methyltransferase, partial [Bdellovibrio sp.]
MITSPQNPFFKKLKSLLKAKGIKKEKLCLIHGDKIIREVLKAPLSFSHYVYSPPLDSHHLRPLLEKEGIKPFFISHSLFKELDPLNTQCPLLVCHIPLIEKINLPLSPPQGLEVLCALGDPANLGALFRCAEAFSVNKVFLFAESAFPLLPKVIKSSSGSVFRTPFAFLPSIQDFKEDPYTWALDLHGTPLPEWSPPPHLRLLVGEEGPGLPSGLKVPRLYIPIKKTVESLNAVSAVSIA